MLEFNPLNRPSAMQCLKSKLFDKIRIRDLEKCAENQVFVHMDKWDVSDVTASSFDNGHEISIDDCESMLLQEVVKFQQDLA